MIKELPNETLFISYICLRDSNSSGYPLRSPEVADQLFSCKSQDDIINFLQKLEKNVRSNWNDCTSKEWFTRYLNPEENQSTFQQEAKKREKSEEEEKSKRIPSENKSIICLFLLSVLVHIIVLDESASLLEKKLEHPELTLFRAIRRSLKQKELEGSFVVLLDTLTTMSNFAPPSHLDRSAREGKETKNLFHPFIELKSMYLFGDLLPLSPTFTPEQYDKFFKLGRPLWNTVSDFQKRITLAVTKLLGGTSTFGETNIDQHFAILSVRLGEQISTTSNICTRLVNSHMAVCTNITNSRDCMDVQYCVEPILVHAASQFWRDEYMLKILLNSWSSFLAKGYVEPGVRGEVLAKIVILRTVNVCTKGSFHHPILLSSFLEKLGADMNSHPLKDHYLNLTHFIQLTEEPTPELIELMWRTGTGGTLVRNTTGADLVIPLYCTTTKTLAYILVSVKNYLRSSGERSYPHSATSSLTPKCVFRKVENRLPHVAVYMQFGDPPKQISGRKISGRVDYPKDENVAPSTGMCFLI